MHVIQILLLLSHHKASFLQVESHGPLTENCHLLNTSTKRCSCPFFISTGHTCSCYYAYLAAKNMDQLQLIKEPAGQVRALLTLERGMVPHTAEELVEYGGSWFTRELPIRPYPAEQRVTGKEPWMRLAAAAGAGEM